MKTRVCALLLLVVLLLCGCREGSYEPTALTVGLATPFERSFNYFQTANESNLAAIYLCAGSLMEPTGEGRWQPYLGEITAEKTADGLIATMTLRKNVYFPDGKTATADDLIFLLKMLCDPGYTGPHSLRDSAIKGAAAYYWDDPNGAGVAPDFEKQAAAKYGPAVISEADLKTYLSETALAGEWGGNLEGYRGGGRTWRQYLEDEGLGKELSKVSSNAADTLALVVDHYYDKYRDNYDATAWYAAKLRKDYMKKTLDDGVDLPEIPGVVKKDDLTVTVEFTDPEADYLEILYLPILMAGNYNDYYKGGGDKVASSARKKVVYGAGSFVFKEYEDGILTLERNKKFSLGAPKLNEIRMRSVESESIALNCHLRQLSLGLVPEKDAKNDYGCGVIALPEGTLFYNPADCNLAKLEPGGSFQYYLNRLRLYDIR